MKTKALELLTKKNQLNNAFASVNATIEFLKQTNRYVPGDVIDIITLTANRFFVSEKDLSDVYYGLTAL